MDSDAHASIELEDDSLSAGLDDIAAKFSAIAAQINSQFANANVQLTRTAANARSIGTAAPVSAALGRGMALAANAARMAATAIGGIVTVATKLAPWVKYLPDSAGKWAPKVKEVAAEYVNVAAKVSLVVKAAKALSGELSVLGAGFAVLELREIGASRAAAIFGAVGALALSKTISGARGAMSAVSRLGSGLNRAAGGVSRMIGGIAGGFSRAVSSVGSLVSPVAGVALGLGPIGAAAAAIGIGFAGVKKSVSEAADMQGLQSSFITLLGTADAARKRMAEISKFSASTPFQIPGVAKASRVLEVLTRGALSTGAGLRLVGDAAAVTQQPIEDLAVHIGRLYDGLMNGREVGESLRRMQELGLVSANTRARLENLQAEGQKGAKVWAVVAGELGRFSGEMSRQSMTWNGLLSNVADEVGNLFRAFGAPVITALTPFMQRMLAWLDTLTVWASRAGTIFAGWSALIGQIFADGQMGQALYLAGKVGFMMALNYLLGALVGVGNVLWAIMGGVARAFVSVLSECASARFWAGLGNALAAAVKGMVALLLEGIAKLLDALSNVPGIGKKAAEAAKDARAGADSFTKGAGESGRSAGANLAPVLDKLGKDVSDTLHSIPAEFMRGQKDGGDLIDVSGAKGDLGRFIQPIAARARDAVNAAAKAAEKGGLPPPVESAVSADGKKHGNDVASLQRIGGGGGFSINRADPLLAETRNQTAEIRGMRSDLKDLAGKLGARGGGSAAVPVFGAGA